MAVKFNGQPNWYGYEDAKGFPGMKATSAVDTVESFAAEGEVKPGTFVTRGTDKDEQAIKCAVINSVRGDSVDLNDKSVDYINAAFDLCKDDAIKRQDAMDKQKRSINSDKREDGSIEEELTTIQLMEKLREDESQLYMKEI